MKFILILFVCINDPSAPIESTCMMQPLDMTFNSMNECQLTVDSIYKDIDDPRVHVTSFCAQKNLTSI